MNVLLHEVQVCAQLIDVFTITNIYYMKITQAVLRKISLKTNTLVLVSLLNWRNM